MKKEYRYSVKDMHSGISSRRDGNFPTDMLRYDSARILSHTGMAGEKYLIEGERPPTIGRWESFGWAVLDPIEEIRIIDRKTLTY